MKTNVQITGINLVIHIDNVTVHQHLSVHLVHEVIVIVILLLLPRSLVILIIVIVEAGVSSIPRALCRR